MFLTGKPPSELLFLSVKRHWMVPGLLGASPIMSFMEKLHSLDFLDQYSQEWEGGAHSLCFVLAPLLSRRQ